MDSESLTQRLKDLYPIFTSAAIGDFNIDVEIPEQEDELTPVWVGVTLMVETIKEKLDEIELTRSQIEESNKALAEYNDSLKASLKINQDIMVSYRQLVSVIMHDLKSPVGNLIQLIELKKEDEETSSEVDDLIFLCAEGLQTTLNDMNKELASRSLAEVHSDGDFSKIWQSVQNQFLSQINDLEPVFELSIEEFSDFEYPRSEIKSLLTNLLSNSIKYRSRDRRLQVDLTVLPCSDNMLKLSFKDNGIGINLSKNGDKIFGQFQRFSDKSDGNGLGLYLTKLKVEGHGGKAEVESREGEWSVFTFYLKNLRQDLS